MQKTTLIVDNQRGSMITARRLHGLGHKVIAGVSGDFWEYVNYSRFVSKSVRMAPMDGDPAAAIADINRIFEHYPEITGLYPICETGARLVSRNWDAFPAHITKYCVEPHIVNGCADKAVSAALCDELGIPVAARLIAHDLASLQAASAEVGYPQVIKPDESNHDVWGHKVLRVNDAGEFAAMVTRWPPEEHKRLIVQRWVEGPRWNVYWIAERGKLYIAGITECTRTSTADHAGYGTLAITRAPRADLRQWTEALIERLNYHGPGSAQYIINDKTGEITFLEINPRNDASIKVLETAGHNLVESFVRLVEGEPLTPRPDPWDYKVGNRFIWVKGDLPAFKKLARNGQWGRFAKRAGATLVDSLRSHHALFSLDDPGPAIGCHLHPILRRLPQAMLPRNPVALPADPEVAPASPRPLPERVL